MIRKSGPTDTSSRWSEPYATATRRVLRTVKLTAAPARMTRVVQVDVEMKQVPLQTVVRFPFPDSIVMGLQYTKIWTYNIFKTLKRIVTGKVSADTLGGDHHHRRGDLRSRGKRADQPALFPGHPERQPGHHQPVAPSPVLDGGHLLFLFIEKIKGSPVSDRSGRCRTRHRSGHHPGPDRVRDLQRHPALVFLLT